MTDPNYLFRDIAALPWWLKAYLAVILLAVSLAVYAVWTTPARERARCHRWFGAASTSRDTLWVTTLRPECAALLPPRMP